MISKEGIKYSLSNLKKRKARSFLTLLSIFIGITAIFIFVSFGLGLYSYVDSFMTESTADKVTISPRGIGFEAYTDEDRALTREDLRAVERTSGVYEATGLVYKISEIQQGKTRKYTFLIGYDPEKAILGEFLNVGIIKGRDLSSNDQGNVVLGYNFMFDNKILPRGLDLNDRIIVNGVNLRVVGFYESVGNPQDDAQIYVNLDYIDRIYPDSKNNFGMIVARVDVSNIEQIIEDIEKNLRRTRDVEKGKEDFYVASFQDLLESYSSALNVIVGFIILIALISVFVSVVNTSNTMITSVLERTREIGVMKSIGAKNSEIFNIFLFESSFLGFLGGVIGVLVGVIITSIGGLVLAELGWSFLKPLYSIELFLGCILFATITGAISGVWPAINAAKTNPVDALRYE